MNVSKSEQWSDRKKVNEWESPTVYYSKVASRSTVLSVCMCMLVYSYTLMTKLVNVEAKECECGCVQA